MMQVAGSSSASASRVHPGAVPSPNNLAQPITLEIRNNLLQGLSDDHWPEVLSDLIDHRPNLARVVCVMNCVLPQAQGDTQRVLGSQIQVADPLRGYRKPIYIVTEMASNSLRNNPLAFGSRFVEAVTWATARVISRPPDEILSTSQGKGQPQLGTLQQQVYHTDLIKNLLIDLLQKAKDLKAKPSHSSGTRFDLTSDAADELIARLTEIRVTSEVSRPKQFNMALHEQILQQHSNVLTGSVLPSSLGQALAAQCPDLAVAYTAVEAALQIQDPNANAVKRFNVASEDHLIEQSRQRCLIARSSFAEAKKSGDYYPTFIPNVSRTTMNEDGKPVFELKLDEDNTVLIEDFVTIVDYALMKAEAHLKVQTVSDLPKDGEYLPLFVYQAAAKFLDMEVPGFLMQREQALRQQIENNVVQANKVHLANQERILLAKQETARKKEELAVQNAAYCVEHSLSHPDSIVFSIDASPANSTVHSKEYVNTLRRHGASSDLFGSIKTALGVTHDEQQVSSNARTLSAIQNRDRFQRDNRCWLRAIWISMLHQVQDPDRWQQLENAMLHYSSQPENEYVTPLLNALVHDFQHNRGELLNRGEVSGLQQPAHFMSGRTILDYLQSRGVAVEALGTRAVRRDIERELIRWTTLLAMGARGDEKPQFDRKLWSMFAPNPMMDSEFVVAVHRVVGLPCIVFERDEQNQLCVRYSGSVEDRGLADISATLVELDSNGEVQLEDLQPLFQRYQNLPIIMLNAEHYTVYLPKPSVAEHETSSARFMEIDNLIDLNSDDESIAPETDPARDLAATSSNLVHAVVDGKLEVLKANRINFEQSGYAVVGETSTNSGEFVQQMSRLFDKYASGLQPHLFEFISPLARVSPEKSRHPGVLSQLLHQLEQCEQLRQVCVLNGRQILKAEKLPMSGCPQWIERFAVYYREPSAPDQVKTAFITRASPDFHRQFLNAEQLQALIGTFSSAGRLVNQETDFFSAMGLGRSAALAVLEKACMAINQGSLTQLDQIDLWLEEKRQQGIRDRGPGFLAHPQQLHELKRVIGAQLEGRAV